MEKISGTEGAKIGTLTAENGTLKKEIEAKSEETKRQEREILKSFGVQGKGTPEQREAAEVIAARTNEAMNQGRRKMYVY